MREMDLEEDCTNLRIKRLETEVSSAAPLLEREVRKRWPCLLRAQRTLTNGFGGGPGGWRWLHGSCRDTLKQAAIVIWDGSDAPKWTELVGGKWTGSESPLDGQPVAFNQTQQDHLTVPPSLSPYPLSFSHHSFFFFFLFTP